MAFVHNLVDDAVRGYTNIQYHSTTIAYIVELVKPVANALETLNTVPNINQWILATFTGDLLQNMTNTLANEHNLVVEQVITIILQALIHELMKPRFFEENRLLDLTVLPWDIQGNINNIPSLTALYGTQTNTLPVTISLNNRQFVHLLSMEFTCGLLLFLYTSHVDINISMFNEEFGSDYYEHMDSRFNFISEQEAEEEENTDMPDGKYTVTVAEDVYTFNTPEFMQGFVTGALWSNVDHHAYWSKLLLHNIDAEDNHTEQELTF